MLKRLLVAATLCVLSQAATAQQAIRVQTCGQIGSAPVNVSPLFIDANGNLCTFGPIVPNYTNGYGVLAVSTSSISIATATLGPNSGAFPTSSPPMPLEIKNFIGSAGVVYVCPFGGTCTAANGYPLAQGESKSWSLKPVSGAFVAPTVIAASSATIAVSF